MLNPEEKHTQDGRTGLGPSEKELERIKALQQERPSGPSTSARRPQASPVNGKASGVGVNNSASQ